MFSQIYVSPSVIRQVYSGNLVSDPYYVSYFTQFFVQLFTLIFAIWNLDFFWSWYGYICIYPDLKYRKYLCLSMLLVSTHYSLYYSPSSLSSYMIILPFWFWRPFEFSQMFSYVLETLEHSQLPYSCFSHFYCSMLCQNFQYILWTPDILTTLWYGIA